MLRSGQPRACTLSAAGESQGHSPQAAGQAPQQLHDFWSWTPSCKVLPAWAVGETGWKWSEGLSMACQDENESLLVQHQRQEPARLSGMSVASSIDRPISRAPSRSNLGPSAGSQHGHSHSSGSEEVRHPFPSQVPPCRAPLWAAPPGCARLADSWLWICAELNCQRSALR